MKYFIDTFYCFYYIFRNFVFSILFSNSACLKFFNSLIKIRHGQLSLKILKQSELLFKDLDEDLFDIALNYGSGFTSYRSYFPAKLYFDYDKYIYGILNKDYLFENPEKPRTSFEYDEFKIYYIVLRKISK
jgi:hypothetical protein